MKKAAFLSILIFFQLLNTANAGMNDYCVNPISSATTTKPNILLLMDYSGSMQFPAYITCDYHTWGPYDGVVVNCQTPGSSSSDNYSASTTYYGLFDTTRYYQYASSRFQVNTSCTDTNKIGSSNTCISGNLLNWITSTRIDVSRKVLTGGRTNTGTSDIYQSEGARLVYTDTGLRCKFTITTVSIGGAGAAKSRTIKIENQSGYTCPLGALSDSSIDIAPVDPSADTGIIQDFYDKATFEFMIFNSDYPGKLLSAKDGTQSSIISAIFNEAPYDGTPTGEGLLEAKDFFKQSNDNSYQSNASDLNLANGSKDPLYDGGGGGSSKKVPCRKCFTLLISDGVWNGSRDPVPPARTMRISDLRSDLAGTQRVTTYAVYAFGDKDPETELQGRQAMITTAIFGGFDDSDSNNYPYPFTGNPSDSKDVTYPLSQCNPSGTWNPGCKEWDKTRSGLPYNYFEADDGEALKTSLTNALNDMLRRTSSGTAASVLASSEGSGANILQSVYYPKRLIDDVEISWTGEMQNLWYYIDPYLQFTSIREDTNLGGASGENILKLTDDYAIEFFFDIGDSRTKVNRYSTVADGSSKTLVDTLPIEATNNLWEAGILLFQRDLSTSPRTIYTTTDGSNFLSNNFSATNSTTLRPYLQAADATEATKIINYIHGSDQTGCRSRTATISGTTGVWKLGDIVSSTPRIQSSIPANGYHLAAPDGYTDNTYLQYIQGSSYQARGMAYVGGNDGMLHAFKFGKLRETWTGQGTNEKAQLANLDASTALGSEVWSFIPKNALPYLKYLMDPDYCHLNFVDLPSVVVDTTAPTGVGSDTSTAAKTSSSWKTILIGGMGLGGASRIAGDSCSTAATNGTCVKTPITDPSDSTKGLGYSSYFAINVTNPASPQLLWEFSNPDLGFSTSGPAIVRVGDPDKNGKWFAVFASGPTGPIDTSKHQFLGRSNQNLKLFVVDLYTGSATTIDTGITNAFGGSLYSAVIDLDKGNSTAAGRYSDDVFYVGYTQKDTTTPTWTMGGVLRVVTKESADPSTWSVSTLINGIGPVTSSVTKLQDRRNSKLWLYFGTGRFFYRYDNTMDDPLGRRALYGLKEPCYTTSNTIDRSCTSSISSGLVDQTGDSPSSSLSAGATGWYINLDAATQADETTEATTAADAANGAERVITDPLAIFSGVVFFTTYVPSSDLCTLGGKTYVWAVRYNVGDSVGGLMGQALTQVSTGVIQQIDLSTAFSDATNSNNKGNRRTAAVEGMPPGRQGMSVIVPPRPLKKFMHIRQK